MSKKGVRKSVQLSEHVSPIRYNLTLRPDLESFTFSGKEIISFNIKKPTFQITLHSKDLDIETAELLQKSLSRSSTGQ